MKFFSSLIIFLCIFTFMGCELFNSSEIYWQSSEGNIIFEYNLFKDYKVFYEDSTKTYYLFNILASDCNEILQDFRFSPDDTKVAFLINNSSRYEYGTCLVAFDLTQKEGNQIDVVLEVKDFSVSSFSLFNDRIEYRINESEENEFVFN